MATLEEVSIRLMKPAKDLADWTCRFSEILEEYRSLVEKHENVNLSKAGLVIQNLAATYGRRLEYLFQETTLSHQTLVDQEVANESKKNTKKDGKEKKTVIDIIDFEPIDFTGYISKNINIKQRIGANNGVKLLGQRFPQLENATKPSKSDQENSTEIDPEQDNEQGVGRKYAFRCNQYITESGMLVEHLRPEGLANRSSRSELGEKNSRESTENRIDLNDGEDNELDAEILPPNGMTLDNCRAVSTPLPDSENYFMNVSAVDSGRGSSVRTMMRPESSLSSDRGENWDSYSPRPCSRLSMDDVASPEPRNDSGITRDETSLNDSSPTKRGAEDSETSANSEPDVLSPKSETVVVAHEPRSKRLKSIFDMRTMEDAKPLEPIPFDGVPDKLSKSLTDFKLPCSISILKRNDTLVKRNDALQKRKIRSDARKKKLKKKSQNEAEDKMNDYSLTKQLFCPFMKEELDCLPKSFNKHLRKLRELEALESYEPVTNESKKLLGYRRQDRKSSDSPDEYEETSLRELEMTPEELTEPPADDFPMPDTPESFNGPEPMSPPPQTCSSRIERLVHDIYENCDVRTEQEEAVARWHEEIQAKLKQNKNRPKFEMAEYTSRVVKTLKNNDGRISFNQMVLQNQPPEAARYLLASLMLANKYNIQIDASNEEGNFTLLLIND
ncbi:uncharacterized protein Cap-H2 [Venturia canescens]|uniref:uncharacterized protein Cap-H2 n=1 Tax=Venturia canescens TaxID=32260 RepID=UPI001C9C6FD7|nr:uncharacterized protein LOC122408575 [Venturia canescens]XP_043271365.1 uncharacterized protein LOC122408575 [Venturia canescens]